MLCTYEVASGQKVNLLKSSIFFSLGYFSRKEGSALSYPRYLEVYYGGQVLGLSMVCGLKKCYLV